MNRDPPPTAAEESDERRAEALLAAQLAHDIRSPIAAIVALTESLAQQLKGVVGEQHLRQLRLVHVASLNLDALVSDVLELSHPGALDRSPEPVDFSLRELLSELQELLQPAVELSGATIEYHTPRVHRRSGLAAPLRRTLFNLSCIPLNRGYDGLLEIRAAAGDGQTVQFTIRSGKAILDHAVIEMVRDVALRRRPRDHTCFSAFGLELAFRLVDSMGSALEATTDPETGTVFSFALHLPESDPLDADA